jgi:hypothetical protein
MVHHLEASEGDGPANSRSGYYDFFDCGIEATVPFCEAAAAMVFGFSFFGFLASRLPFCSPFAMAVPPEDDIRE